MIPGAMTPLEIEQAWEAGADVVKVFPITCIGGAHFIRLLKGPLPEIKVIPTGGVSIEIAADLIKAGAEAVGITTDLVDVAKVRQGRPQELTVLASKYLELVAAARIVSA